MHVALQTSSTTGRKFAPTLLRRFLNMIRAFPRACLTAKCQGKPLTVSQALRPAFAHESERSSSTGLAPLHMTTGSLRPVPSRSNASALNTRAFTRAGISPVASNRQLRTAGTESEYEGSDQTRSPLWALGCASFVAGLGHLLSSDVAQADAPAPADSEGAVEAGSLTRAVETVGKLAGSSAKDAQSAVKLVVSKGLLAHSDLAVRKETLAALVVILRAPEAREAARNSGMFKTAVSVLTESAKAQTAADQAAVLPLAASVLPSLAEGMGKSVGASELVSLVDLLDVPMASGKSDVVEALRLLSAEPSTAPALLKAGVCKRCSALLADAASPQSVAAAAGLLANVNAFEGSWFCSAAHKSPEWQNAVKSTVWLTADPNPLPTKLAATQAVGSILGSHAAQFLAGDTMQAAVMALGFLLADGGDAGLRSAALQGLRKASEAKSAVSAVGESPTVEKVMAAMGDAEEDNALAAMQTVNNLARVSGEVAERLAMSGAVQGLVAGAMEHRGSLPVREAVALLLEAMVASGSEDAKMRVAHYATPVAVALARTTDDLMQLRALELVRRLSLVGVNKFTMQKNFEVIQELVPLLSRSSLAQQAVVAETLAHLASTDNAYYGENARVLGEARGMKPLMVLARSRDAKVHRNATWALACMTACERNHVPMRAAIDTLLQVAERGSPAAQRYAVMALSNLAATQRTRELLVEKGAEAILRKCAQANSGDRMITELIRTTALVNLKRGGKSVFNIPPP